MKDEHKTKDVLLEELSGMRQCIVDLESLRNELKSMLAAQQECEKKYRDLADLLPQIVFEIDLEGNFTYANRYGFESTGYSQEDIDKGLNALQLFVPEDRERVKKNIKKILAGEKSKGNEYTAMRKDGSKFPVIIYSSRIIRNNKPVGLRGVVVDITERKQMEIALQKSKELLSNILSASPIGIGVVEDMRLSWTNESMMRIFGVENKDDYIGQSAKIIYASEEEYERVGQIINNNSKNKIIQFDAKLKRQDGSIFDGHIMMSFSDPSNPMKRAVATISDISWRKRAEKMLRESEEKLRCFIETAPDVLSLWDSELNLVEVNEIGIKMFPPGTEKEDVIGKNILELIPSIKKTGRYNKYRKVLETGRPYFVEDIVPDPKFGSRHLTVKAFRVCNGLGLIATDITERKMAEIALEKSERQLSEQNILLQKKNIALSEIFQQVEKEKKEIGEKILANINKLIIPIIKKLKNKDTPFKDDYLSLLEQNLRIITSPFLEKVATTKYILTPREIEICNMLKAGFTSKNIARLLNLSYNTVNSHRNNIRRKLGVKNKKINIVSYLKSF